MGRCATCQCCVIDPCSRRQNLKQISSVCALTRSGLGARHIPGTTTVKLQLALLLMQPVWRWSPLAPLNSHLIPPRSLSRWLFATANPEQETRLLMRSGVLIPPQFSSPLHSPFICAAPEPPAAGPLL